MSKAGALTQSFTFTGSYASTGSYTDKKTIYKDHTLLTLLTV